MTAEVTFAKTFLGVLDVKPAKLPSDYAADLRTLELTIPYTLPRNPHPMTKRGCKTSTAPGSERATSISLKSLRNPPLDLSLPAQPLTTSILDLKRRVAQELGLRGVDKVRLLYKKKPWPDSKSVKDVLGDDAPSAGGVEFSVMVMGGAPAAGTPTADEKRVEAPPEMAKEDVEMGDAPVAPGEKSGLEVLGENEFWADLKGFLELRVKDSAVADKAVTIFQAAWNEKGGE